MTEYKYQLPTGGIVTVKAEDEDEALKSLHEILARDFPEVNPDDVSDA